MEVFIRNQASILLDALFIGMIIMAFYDVFRLFRRIIRHGRLIRDLEDLIFWIIAGFIVFSLVYSRNNGNIRWFIIVGVALGMYLYYVSFGRFVVKYTAKYINKLINMVLKKPIRKAIMTIRLILERVLGANAKKLREKEKES